MPRKVKQKVATEEAEDYSMGFGEDVEEKAKPVKGNYMHYYIVFILF